jgi:acyl dehydratase
MGMNRALIHKKYSGGDPFAVTADAGTDYADATNARIARYRGADALTPPMYGVAFTFAALGAPLFDPDIQVDMMRLVHGEQDMRFLAPVRAGDIITAESVIADIVEKTSGEVIDIAITAKNQRGETVLEAKSGLFIRGARKRDNADAERAAKDAEEAAWTSAPVAWTRTEKVADDQSKRYAEVSGDRNPIHVDEEVAKMAGLPGIILHGLCTMAFVHNACVEEAGGDPMRIKRLAVRFNRPVLMGDVLTIEAHGPKAGPWSLRVTNQEGVVVLKNGVAELG